MAKNVTYSSYAKEVNTQIKDSALKELLFGMDDKGNCRGAGGDHTGSGRHCRCLRIGCDCTRSGSAARGVHWPAAAVLGDASAHVRRCNL